MATRIRERNYENDVYVEIVNYLNGNRTLLLDELIPYLNSRFSRSSMPLNKEGIIKIVNSLIQQNIIVEGSKLTREEILLNEKRNKIYNYIVNNPGVYYYNIMKSLSISSHVVIWHLNILQELNYIRKTTIDKNTNSRNRFCISIHSYSAFTIFCAITLSSGIKITSRP